MASTIEWGPFFIVERMTMETPDLRCQNLVKSFGATRAVDDVSFDIPKGSFFSILGPSGCGKTTIMRMIAGFLEPTSGDIEIKGRSVLDVPPNKRPVNMVFQHLALFPTMNIAENIGYGLRRRGVAKPEITRKVGEVLDRIGLPGIETRGVNELSGGQKQRVAIARCMVLEPDVLLLDEPLGALDLKLREQMKVELKSLQADFNTTFVYITHDQGEALVMSDRIAVMNAGQFEQVGSGQDLYYRPETRFVASFVGDSNSLKGTIEGNEAGIYRVRTHKGLLLEAVGKDRSLPVGAKVELYLRPETVRLEKGADNFKGLENTTKGSVEQILFNGANSRVVIQPDDTQERIEATLPQTVEFFGLQSGDKVHLGWGADQAPVFEQKASS